MIVHIDRMVIKKTPTKVRLLAGKPCPLVMTGMRRILIVIFCTGCMLFELAGCGSDTSSSYQEDPLAKEQWYLTGDPSDSAVVHINLPTPSRYTGKGVIVAVVDNGIDLNHEDLAANIEWGNFSYLPSDYDFSNADHGTAVAGIIAAVAGNGIGIRGIASGAKLLSFNAIRTPSMDNIADALVREKNRVSISNNSWGDFNSWGEPLGLRSVIESALQEGTRTGRNGKGIVYIFSAGNGATVDANGIPSDNVNYSGLVNNQYTIPVCALDPYGKKAGYSETGATLVVCAPSKDLDKTRGIVTTDVTGDLGYNSSTSKNEEENTNYTKIFGGTSAAAPMVSGVVALMLEANPGLSWRDVRYILAKSAKKNDPQHSDWTTNGAGLNINHSYGFGLVDADHAIRLSETWTLIPEETSIELQSVVGEIIPDNDLTGISNELNVSDNIAVEFVDIYFDAPNHTRLGDLEVDLISPLGTRSVLSERHNQTFEVFRYKNWRFGSMRNLGESSKGIWRLEVRDKRAGEIGTWKGWRLKIHGFAKAR